MALKSATRIGTKLGLGGGALYLYYEIGLWKGSDETIENYNKLKKDVKTLYESTPKDVQKWGDYAASTVQSNVEPYKKSVADFRQNYLSWAPDLSYLKEEGDGIIKPTWNKGVAWTIEVLKGSPQAIKHWSQIGWDKITEFTNEQQPATAQENKP